MALGRTVDAIRAFEEVKGVSAAGASFAFAGLADIALYEGRIADAIAILKEGIAADTASKNRTALARKHVALADALLARGDPAGAAREAEAAIAMDQSDPVALTAGMLLAKTGQRAAAQKIAEMLAQKLELDPQAYAELIEAEVSLGQRQPRAAIERVRAAQKKADTWIGRVIGARTLLEAGAFPDASSEIDAAIRRAGEATAITLDESPTFRYFPQLHYYKGVALEGINSPAARGSFETFLAIKAKGDETGGLVAEARRRIAQPIRAGSSQ
jgi:tetratricopeptide (TPR) repeat protein